MDYKKIINRIALFIFLSVCIYFILKMHWDEDERNEFPKYTVGVINDSYAVIGYFDYKYSYEYDGEIFERTGSGNKKMNDKIGMKYIVKISSKNPKNAILLTELRVCDTFEIVPGKGWTKIPDGIICKKTNANKELR